MKREEKNAATRRRILDAAADEFSRRGYDGASLNTVCARSGLSKGIIYHYFKAKDELYLTCAQECFDAMNIARLTDLLRGAALREGLTADAVIGDFRSCMDFFNLRFRTALAGGRDPERVMREHEKRCYRQIGILLYGVIGDKA